LSTERTRVAVLGIAVLLAACRSDMQDQPKYLPLAASAFFADGRASRPLVEGVVARGQIEDDTRWSTGKAGAEFVSELPVALTGPLLARGRERYDIYCSVCHDRVGTGNGIVVQRGFRQPHSFHTERLRQMPDGYLFDVITNGYGVMPDYAQQVAIADRWAVVAYVRALQLSQDATLADVPDPERARLEAGK